MALNQASRQDAVVAEANHRLDGARQALAQRIDGGLAEARQLAQALDHPGASVRQLQHAAVDVSATRRAIAQASQQVAHCHGQLRDEQVQLQELRQRFWRADANARKVERLDERHAREIARRDELQAEYALEAVALRTGRASALPGESGAGESGEPFPDLPERP